MTEVEMNETNFTESETDDAPTVVQKDPLDVTPYRHGIWCSVGGGKPFINVIEGRQWDDDREGLWFWLGTHNTAYCKLGETIGVVEREPAMSPDVLARFLEKDALQMLSQDQRQALLRNALGSK